MDNLVEIIMCANPLTLQFQTKIQLSNHKYCMFFSLYNIEFCNRELTKIGARAEWIVKEIIEFREVRQVFVTSNKVTVVLHCGKQWETIPDQIVRIFEKAFDDLEEGP